MKSFIYALFILNSLKSVISEVKPNKQYGQLSIPSQKKSVNHNGNAVT